MTETHDEVGWEELSTGVVVFCLCGRTFYVAFNANRDPFNGYRRDAITTATERFQAHLPEA